MVRSVQQDQQIPSERATDLDVRTRDGGVDDRLTGPGLVYCLNAGPVCSSVRSRGAARTRGPYGWSNVLQRRS